MDKVADILGATMRRTGHPQSPLAWLRGMWPTLAGEPLSAHTRPKYFVSGVLEVTVTGDGWVAQLETMGAPLRDRINRGWGRELVRIIKFEPARIPFVRHELDNNYTPFVRTKSRLRSEHRESPSRKKPPAAPAESPKGIKDRP